MRFFSVLAGAALAALAFAQDDSIAFTAVPASVVVGHSYNLTWGGGDSTSAVTIALRKGPVDSISTVQILTTSATNSSYIWTPSSSLINGDDYTLQITEGLNDINFSGDFTVSGGVDPVSASISSILASASSSASAALASANSTITALASATSSLAAASSSGTGTALPRNTTFSSATLASETGSSAMSTGTGTASSTSSGTATSSSSTAGAVVLTAQWTSPVAIIGAMIAAIVYAI